MEPTKTAFGIWNGGRFVEFGRKLDEDELKRLVRQAYDGGVRTFVTADAYSEGGADYFLGKALSGMPRDSYCLAGMVGHDFYEGKRVGSGGWERFTASSIRSDSEYEEYLETATRKSLERCSTDHFDLLMLHNPDSIGYTSEVVWSGMERLRNMGMTNLLGVAPGPANGFALDIIGCFEKYGDSIDWIMLILNPLEPWPMNEVLPAAFKYDVSAMARVVECGGLFHDDVKPGHVFSTKDHRKHRPVGWLEVGQEKMERMRHIARRHGLTMLQLACQWTMQQPCVESIVPTLTEEVSDSCKSIQHKLTELLSLGEGEMLSPEEIKEIDEIGDNRNCLPFSQRFKGATPGYQGAVQADRWELSDGLWEVAQRWGFDLDSLKSSMQFAD